MAERAPAGQPPSGPKASVVYWKYLLYWLLLFGLLYLVSLFGVVAEA